MIAFTGGAPSDGPVLQRSATPVANPFPGTRHSAEPAMEVIWPAPAGFERAFARIGRMRGWNAAIRLPHPAPARPQSLRLRAGDGILIYSPRKTGADGRLANPVRSGRKQP